MKLAPEVLAASGLQGLFLVFRTERLPGGGNFLSGKKKVTKEVAQMRDRGTALNGLTGHRFAGPLDL